MQVKEMIPEPLLDDQKQYVVAQYQCTYAWQRDQLDRRLSTDILSQADALRDKTTSLEHSIGSLLLALASNGVAGRVGHWLVVDGQLSLTTLMLAIAALRDNFRAESPQDIDRICRECLSFSVGRLVGDAGLHAAIDAHTWFIDQLPNADVTA